MGTAALFFSVFFFVLGGAGILRLYSSGQQRRLIVRFDSQRSANRNLYKDLQGMPGACVINKVNQTKFQGDKDQATAPNRLAVRLQGVKMQGTAENTLVRWVKAKMRAAIDGAGQGLDQLGNGVHLDGTCVKTRPCRLLGHRTASAQWKPFGSRSPGIPNRNKPNRNKPNRNKPNRNDYSIVKVIFTGLFLRVR